MAGPLAQLTEIPPLPGSYALRVVIDSVANLSIGSLGSCTFSSGVYVYLGSAFGPGGLRARINHHLKRASRPHWHVDYLREAGSISGGWYSTAPQRLECVWSRALLRLPGVAIPLAGFGASDCRAGCASHLVLLPDAAPSETLAYLLEREAARTCGSPVFLAGFDNITR